MTDEFSVKKYGAYIPVSDQLAMEYGIRPPTEEYLAQKAYWAERARSKREAAMALLAVALPALDSITEPIARMVLDLHQRGLYETALATYPQSNWVCFGCDIEGYEADHPTWPCTTTRLIAQHYGIELPKDACDRPDDGSLDV